MYKILMTGASGYIGSNVLKYLSKAKIKPDVISRSVLPSYIHKQCGKVYYMDLAKIKHSSDFSGYSLFLHMASANDIDSKNPYHAITWTTLGTRNCLELCKNNNIKKFIFLSTFQIYGKLNKIINEKRIPQPLNDYAISHQFSEDYIKMYQRTTGIKYIILRPSNIFGAPENKYIDRWSLVPLYFCKEAIEKQTITLLTSGKQVYDFLNLNDLGKLTVRFCLKFDPFENSIINICSGNQYSIIEIANLVAERYSHLFQKPCKVLVNNLEPKAVVPFDIDRELINKSGHIFSGNNELVKEIDKILSMLIK